ncbi:hypothetical protein OG894_09950 [Streptomyces sp. NBC_01724]|uniref:hypothetical protein n=1 Tax=Streptomyces sp. NBC_01724 TaxID=2975922 RepID=UPI002E373830|nr:hypothetical protein [Streptomyces sp. NBC_01724]
MNAEERVLMRVRDLGYGMSNRVDIGDRVYVDGDTFTVPADSVTRWLAMGLVELATEREDTAPTMQRLTRENSFDHWLGY